MGQEKAGQQPDLNFQQAASVLTLALQQGAILAPGHIESVCTRYGIPPEEAIPRWNAFITSPEFAETTGLKLGEYTVGTRLQGSIERRGLGFYFDTKHFSSQTDVGNRYDPDASTLAVESLADMQDAKRRQINIPTASIAELPQHTSVETSELPQLPHYLQEPLTLFRRGMTSKEVATVLNLPLTTVAVYKSRLTKMGAFGSSTPTKDPTSDTPEIDGTGISTTTEEGSGFHDQSPHAEDGLPPLAHRRRSRQPIRDALIKGIDAVEVARATGFEVQTVYVERAKLRRAAEQSHSNPNSPKGGKGRWKRTEHNSAPSQRNNPGNTASAPPSGAQFEQRRAFEEPVLSDKDPDTLSDAEMIVWQHMQANEQDTIKAALEQQLGHSVRNTQIQAVFESLAKKGVYPESPDQLHIKDRLYGKDIAFLLQQVLDRSPSIQTLFPNISSLWIPAQNKYALQQLISACNHSKSNISPSLRIDTSSEEEYVQRLIEKIQFAFQHDNRSTRLQVLTVPDRLRVEAIYLLDWLYSNYTPPQDKQALQIAV